MLCPPLPSVRPVLQPKEGCDAAGEDMVCFTLGHSAPPPHPLSRESYLAEAEQREDHGGRTLEPATAATCFFSPPALLVCSPTILPGLGAVAFLAEV